MSRQAGSVVRGFSKPRRISVHNGPAAGGGYVLRTGLKVKAGGNHRTDGPLPQRLFGLVKIDGQAGRSGRARTCDPRFWRPVLYQLSYTPRAEPASPPIRAVSSIGNAPIARAKPLTRKQPVQLSHSAPDF